MMFSDELIKRLLRLEKLTLLTVKDFLRGSGGRYKEIWKEVEELEKQVENQENVNQQLKEANELLLLFSGKDGYEKVNKYITKWKVE
jgi:vacuolar-type H+-ATPase subunit C/Vma6